MRLESTLPLAQSTYYISLTNDGSGNYTPAAQRGGVAPSAGTSLPGGGSDLLSAAISTDVKTALVHAMVVVADDRAAGN